MSPVIVETIALLAFFDVSDLDHKAVSDFRRSRRWVDGQRKPLNPPGLLRRGTGNSESRSSEKISFARAATARFASNPSTTSLRSGGIREDSQGNSHDASVGGVYRQLALPLRAGKAAATVILWSRRSVRSLGDGCLEGGR